MTKRILGVLLVIAVVTACKDDDGDKIKHFSAQVDVNATASIIDDKYNAIVVFSTDGGKTFVDYPMLKPGDAYKAKVIHRTSDGDVDITTDGCYAFDWSASNPAPTAGGNTGIADFVMQSNSDIVLATTDYHGYDASKWSGAWFGIEDGFTAFPDANTFTQDQSNPNKFTMDNYWGIGNSAYIILSPSTTFGTQKVTVPAQWTSEADGYQILEGSGTYDQCRQTLDFTSTFVTDADANAGLDTVEFDYHFQRVKP